MFPPNLESVKSSLFNAWSLFLLWVIGGVFIPKEFLGPKIARILKRDLEATKCKPSLNNVSGKCVVITGGSRGIGIVVVKKLLAAGMHVIIGSSANETQREVLENDFKTKIPASKISVWHLDLSSMTSVKEFASKFQQKAIPLNLLINNAGIMFVDQKETEDQFESHFAVNYFGHCLLTKLLLPQLESAGTETKHARIVNVTSCVALISKIRFHDLQGKIRYSPYHAYMQSKLAQLMFSYALNRHLESKELKVKVFCVHPGVVDTGLHQNVWWAPKAINRLYRTPEEGSETILAAALSDALESGKGGQYLENCLVAKSSKYSLNIQIQNQLWEETLNLLENWAPGDWGISAHSK